MPKEIYENKDFKQKLLNLITSQKLYERDPYAWSDSYVLNLLHGGYFANISESSQTQLISLLNTNNSGIVREIYVALADHKLGTLSESNQDILFAHLIKQLQMTKTEGGKGFIDYIWIKLVIEKIFISDLNKLTKLIDALAKITSKSRERDLYWICDTILYSVRYSTNKIYADNDFKQKLLNLISVHKLDKIDCYDNLCKSYVSDLHASGYFAGISTI